MKILLSLVLTLLLAGFTASARAQNVDNGIWYSPALAGVGFSIEQQNNNLVVIAYTYTPGGSSIWYIGSGPMGSTTSWTGEVNAFANGPAPGSSTGGASQVGTLGSVSIRFAPPLRGAVAVTGTLTWNGASYPIQRFSTLGATPQSMLGQWVFHYTIISTWANKYTFTDIGAATTNGTGTFLDRVNLAAGDCYTGGSLAGLCMIAEFSAAGATLNVFLYDPRYINAITGVWVAASGNLYEMRGTRTKARAAVTATDRAADLAGSANRALLMAERDRELAVFTASGAAKDQQVDADADARTSAVVELHSRLNGVN